MEFIEQLKKPRNPYDVDLKALREAALFVISKIQEIEARLSVTEAVSHETTEEKPKKKSK